MNDYGERFIDRVEAAYKESQAMGIIVKAAWTISMNPSVAERVEALQAIRAA